MERREGGEVEESVVAVVVRRIEDCRSAAGRLGEQRVEAGSVVVHGRHEQSSATVGVAASHVSAAVDEQLQRLQLALPGCTNDGSVALLVTTRQHSTDQPTDEISRERWLLRTVCAAVLCG